MFSDVCMSQSAIATYANLYIVRFGALRFLLFALLIGALASTTDISSGHAPYNKFPYL
jgi:hypothetical protein